MHHWSGGVGSVDGVMVSLEIVVLAVFMLRHAAPKVS